MTDKDLSTGFNAVFATVLQRFAKSWQMGERPSVREFYAAEGLDAIPLLKELVLIDFEFRLKAGEAPTPDEYLQEFAELRTDPDLISQLLKLDSGWADPSEFQLSTGAASVTGIPPLGSTQSSPPANSAALGQRSSTRAEGQPAAALGRFRLMGAIGQGGFGTVYRAIDVDLGRSVAVKFPRKGSLRTDAEKERFFREARSAAILSHPHIVPIYEVGGTSDRPYIVSAFVDGRTLAQEIANRRFDFREAAKIVESLAEALEYAHDRQIIHRDVKPSNIMLDEHGKPFLMDFGLAKRGGDAVLTVDGQILGTPAYMSPEQATGKATVDARSDIYSLGVVLYELVTGKRPFLGVIANILPQVIHEQPVSPDVVDRRVPRDLAMICLQCLQKSPDDRYATARELADDLARYQRGEPVHARPLSLPTRGWRWARRHPKTTLLLAAVLALGATLPVVLTHSANRFETAQKELDQKSRQASEAQAKALRLEAANRDRQERLFVAKGTARLDAGEPIGALPWFAAAFERFSDSHRKPAHRARLISTLRQVPRLVQLWSEGNSIVSVSRSPIEPLIAVGSTDRKVVLHNLMKRDRPGVVLACPKHVAQCLFSPDGKRLAVSGGDEVRIWASANWSAPPMVLPQPGGPKWMAFNRTGRVLAVAAEEEGVRLWDLSKGTLIEPILFPKATINHLAFNADGSLIAAAGADSTVRLWSLTTGKRHGSPLRHENAVNRVCFTPDGKGLFSASNDGTVRLWEVATGSQQSVFRMGSPVVRLVLHPDGTLLAAGCRSGLVQVRNLKAGTGFELRHGGAISYLDFAPESQLLVTASDDRTARFWDSSSGESAVPVVVHERPLNWAEIDADRSRVMTAGLDGTVRTWQFDTHFDGELRLKPSVSLPSVQLSPDSQRLLVTQHAGPAVLCDLRGAELVAMNIGKSIANFGAFSPDSRSLVTVNSQGKLELFDSAGKLLAELPEPVGASSQVNFSPDGKRLVTFGMDGIARVISVSGGIALPLKHGVGLQRAFFSSDGQEIYTVGDRSIGVWDAVSGERRWTRENFTSIKDCCLTPKKHCLVIMDFGQVTIRDMATGKIACTIPPRRNMRIALSRDGGQLATIDADYAARVWDTSTGKPLTGSLQHRQELTCCAFRDDGFLFATGGEAKTARVWDAQTGEAASPPFAHTASLVFVGFCNGGRELVSVSADAAIRRWPLDDDRSGEDLLRQSRIATGQTVDRADELAPVNIQREWAAELGAAQSASR